MNTKRATTQQFTDVEFGSQQVKVPKGGYYDRFRMNPDLNEVAKDPAAGNIDFFRSIPKQLVESRVGPVWAPNFYYRSSNVQVLMLAPMARLREKLPAPLEPLQVLPGYGLVAVTLFSYPVCDNDAYDEGSVAIVLRQPAAKGPNALALLNALRKRHFFAHVLALPVNTDIARVRGVYGYQLPKWLTDIQVQIGTREVKASITNSNGSPDISLAAPLPTLHSVPSQSRISHASMVHLVDGVWHETLVQTNVLRFGQRLLPSGVTLGRHGGPLSKLLDELGAGKILRLDVVADAQVVLNLPAPSTALAAR